MSRSAILICPKHETANKLYQRKHGRRWLCRTCENDRNRPKTMQAKARDAARVRAYYRLHTAQKKSATTKWRHLNKDRVAAWKKRSDRKNHAQTLVRSRRNARAAVLELRSCYVRQSLRLHIPFQIPDSLIRLQRARLQLHRAIREKENATRHRT